MMARCVLVGEASKGLSETIARRFADRCYVPLPVAFRDWLRELMEKGVVKALGSELEASRDLLARDWVIEGLGPLQSLEHELDLYRHSASITVPGPLTIASMISYRGSKLVENPHRASALVPLARSIIEACARARVARVVIWEKAACSLCSEVGAKHGYSWWFVAEALSYVIEPRRDACIYLGQCVNSLAYKALLEAGARCIAIKGPRALETLAEELGGCIDIDIEVLLDPKPIPPSPPNVRIELGARIGICLEIREEHNIIKELENIHRLKEVALSMLKIVHGNP